MTAATKSRLCDAVAAAAHQIEKAAAHIRAAAAERACGWAVDAAVDGEPVRTTGPRSIR